MGIILLILPCLIFSINPTTKSAFQVRNQSSNSVDLRFTLPAWELQASSKGDNSQRVVIQDTPYLFVDEEETLPVLTTSIAIPYSGGADLRVVNQQLKTMSNFNLESRQSILRESATLGKSATLYPADPVVVSDPMMLRDYRIVTINVYPFQYDTTTKEMIVRNSIDIHIDFNDSPSINESAPPLKYSKSFENIYRDMIANYEEVKERSVTYQDPVVLVIYGNYVDATYTEQLNNFINWKKQLGYKVFSASTAVTGSSNTAIKTYIQNAYNTWEDRPDYVILVGDVSGSIAVPSYYVSSGNGDYPYTQVAGNDGLGDIMIGRISVTTADELNTYVAKVMSIEKNIIVASSSWLNKMLLVGDSQSSGISTIYTNQYIHELSYAVNPSYTFTEYYQNAPSPSLMNQALNMGVSVFNYRGYIGMSGWNTTYINQLVNGSKLFHAVIITCATGNFTGTSTTESVVRKGTAASLGGAITAIGMDTSSTHTPMNNCLNGGIFHGIYSENMRNMGAPMLLGKLYLNSIYGVSNPTQAVFFAQICNLIGDPTVKVWVGIPNEFSLTYPATLTAGSTSFEVVVRNTNSQLVEGATVTIVNSAGLQLIGHSDASGKVVFEISNALTGVLTVTASRDDYKPLSGTITIATTGGITYYGQLIDDDNSGNSIGNDNQVVNNGEVIEFRIQVKNTTASSISYMTGTLESNDPYITIQNARLGFAAVAAGGIIANTTAARFAVAANCPDNHRVTFYASGTSGIGPWSLVVPVVVRSGNIEMVSQTFVGSPGNILNPGDTYNYSINVTNSGLSSLTDLYGTLRSYDVMLAVTDSVGFFGTINPGQSFSNSLNTFTVYARSQCVVGMIIPMELRLYNANGYSQTISFTIQLGNSTLTDPLGQDQYGYFIFDDGDTGYPQCPTYNWIGISPSEGGSGTALSITDPGATGDEGDQVGCVSYQTVTMPFEFTFYGRTYNQITISSNGFIAMGATSNSDWRNWRLPGPLGPNPMIAAFWDDLQLNTGNNVYVYYNSTQHFYVVQWNVTSGFDRTSPEVFQAILYDPIYYPTQTGDAPIKLQYKIFNNIDAGSGDAHPHGNSSTIGIKDHNGLVGLEYTFNGAYPTAAKPLANNSALYITTKPLLPENAYLAIEHTQVFDANDNGFLEPGETANLSIRLLNAGLTNATNVSAVLTETDPYITIGISTASYGSIANQEYAYPANFFTISIAANCPSDYEIPLQLNITSNNGSWTRPFILTVHKPTTTLQSWAIDDFSSNHNSVLDPGETASFVLNVSNETVVNALNCVVTLAESSPYLSFASTTITLGTVLAQNTLQARVNVTATSSCPVGTTIPLTVNITSSNGAAYSSQLFLTVGISNTLFTFESNNGGFVATTNTTTGWEWGTSTYAGAYSGTKVWGTVLNSTYTDNSTYELVSPQVLVSSNTNLVFKHRYRIETNYDGGQVQISTDNGSSWNMITPEGGYTHQSLPALGSTPGYNNELLTWTDATFNLSSYAGQQVKIKWYFKTDGSVVREGWFIDDVQFITAGGSMPTGKISGTLTLTGDTRDISSAFVSAGSYICKPAANGTYQFNVPEGSYEIKSILNGYSTTISNVNVVNNTNTANVNITAAYLVRPVGISWLINQNVMNLRWNNITAAGFSGYRVYEKKGTENWSIVNSTTQTTCQVSLSQNGSYDYKIVAMYGANESLYERLIHFVYPYNGTDVQPQAPANISISSLGTTNTISWNSVIQDINSADITVWEYRIYAGDTPYFTPATSNLIGSTTQNTYTDSNVTAKRFYKVRAILGFVTN